MFRSTMLGVVGGLWLAACGPLDPPPRTADSVMVRRSSDGPPGADQPPPPEASSTEASEIAPGETVPGETAPAETAGGLWSPRTVAGYDPHAHLVLSTIGEQPWDGDDLGSEHYRDVMRHTSPEHRYADANGTAGPTTVGHETHHGLQWQHRRWQPHAAFFYFERGFGAYLDSPRRTERLLRTERDGTPVYTEDAYTSAAQVRPEVPAGAAALAAGRFATYLEDPTHASQGVLYLFDEWNAYLASARMAIELERAGYYGRVAERGGFTRTDGLDGMVDFLYFCSVGVVVLDQREPGYVRDNQQLRALYAAFAEETMRWLADGRGIARFQGFHADKLLAHFVSSPENRAVRDFLTNWLGAEWTGRVFGF